MDELKRVEITWLDAWFQPSEMTLEEAKEMNGLARQSIGYLLKLDKEVERAKTLGIPVYYDMENLKEDK